MAKVVGIGGVFFKCRDTAALGEWYSKWLNMPVDPSFGGASLKPGEMPPNSFTVWGPFKETSGYFDPSDRPFMVNLVVDDLDGALRQAAQGGARVMDEIQEEEYGRFGWFIDPEGTKIELWQPPADKSDAAS
ncbi:MAG: VOC family protein [Gammaproteobacteria bacterium]|nr:VOC family protein [Gammaproteobacteria bacterium]